MRGRLVAAAVLVAALVAAVISLRGQVEPSVAAPPDEPAVTTTIKPPPPLLPVRPGPRSRWRTYEVPAGVSAARADPEYVVESLSDPLTRPDSSLLVLARDGSGLRLEYRPQPAGWQPVNWVIMDSTLYVTEIQLGSSDLSGRLVRVELATGQASEIPVHSVRPLSPSLASVGDELVGAGPSTTSQIEFCAIAIRPRTGQERVIACGIVMPIIEPVDGGVLIKLPDSSVAGCSIRLLLPGLSPYGVPVVVGYCWQRQIIPLGPWQVYHLDGPPAAQPLLASRAGREIRLGTAKLSVVTCHGLVYWVSGGPPDAPFGTDVLRWTPGADEVEVIYREQSGAELGWPSCAGGTLTIGRRGPAHDSSALIGLQVLDRP